MGHASYNWNVSDERGLEIIHTLLIEILSEQPKNYLPIQDLVFQLNLRGRHLSIHKLKKHNSMIKYIKNKFGGLTQLIQDYMFYEIVTKQNQIYIYYHEDLYSDDLCTRRLTKEQDWIFV